MDRDNNKTIGKRSVIDPELKVTKVLKMMIDHVIKNEVETGPFITWVSIEQLVWGAGRHWKNCDDPILRAGLLNHMGWRKGALWARAEWEKVTGWDPGELPFKFKEDIRNYIRRIIINPLRENLEKAHIIPWYSPGYIDPNTLALDENHSGAISGYFFILKGEMFANTQNEWLYSQWDNSKTKHIVVQFEFNRSSFHKSQRKQVNMALGKLEMAEKMLSMDLGQLDLIKFDLDKKYITEMVGAFRQAGRHRMV
jgi:hypothetical protein